jgi:hypothetical protein
MTFLFYSSKKRETSQLRIIFLRKTAKSIFFFFLEFYRNQHCHPLRKSLATKIEAFGYEVISSSQTLDLEVKN